MEATYLLAIDLGKRHFQVCGTGVDGRVLFNVSGSSAPRVRRLRCSAE
ncbi:hypothetical protein GCM10011317_52670 [Niveispirillum cyanobacteriorum]|nr:hypothetical protein GCM10011317_52670 [Niveispirillum cyanobacteriorum]